MSFSGGVPPPGGLLGAQLAGLTRERRAQRHLLEEPREQERDDRDHRPEQEHAVERMREGIEEVGMDGRRQAIGLRRAELDAAAQAVDDRAREVRELAREARGEDGAEDRDAEGAAHRAEERRGRGRDADVLRLRVVLHDQDEHLHDEPDADADDQHVERGEPGRRVHAEPREQEHADHERAGARDGEDLVAADAA